MVSVCCVALDGVGNDQCILFWDRPYVSSGSILHFKLKSAAIDLVHANQF